MPSGPGLSNWQFCDPPSEESDAEDSDDDRAGFVNPRTGKVPGLTPESGRHVIYPEISGTMIYDHPSRRPMMLEGSKCSKVRCTTILWHMSAFHRRRTEFHGNWQPGDCNSMKITFSCRLRPEYWCTKHFTWCMDSPRDCYICEAEKIYLRPLTEMDRIRFIRNGHEDPPLMTAQDSESDEHKGDEYVTEFPVMSAAPLMQIEDRH